MSGTTPLKFAESPVSKRGQQPNWRAQASSSRIQRLKRRPKRTEWKLPQAQLAFRRQCSAMPACDPYGTPIDAGPDRDAKAHAGADVRACWHLDMAIQSRMAAGPVPARYRRAGCPRSRSLEEILASGQLPDGIDAPEPMHAAGELRRCRDRRVDRDDEKFEAFAGPIAPHRIFGTLTDADARKLNLIHCATRASCSPFSTTDDSERRQADSSNHVFQDPHCQSRRNRPADHPRLPRAGHSDGGRLFHRRQGRRVSEAGRPGDLHRRRPAGRSRISTSRASSPPPRSPTCRRFIPATASSRRTITSPRSAAAARSSSSARRVKAMAARRRQGRVQEAGEEGEGARPFPAATARSTTRKTRCKIADEIGYPVIIKAAAGGGGRGMRVAHNDVSLRAGFKQAQAEAENAFKDSTVYIEKYVEFGRHVEVQILADNHGNAVHLWERDCSMQRRHQKLVEESPSPVPARRSPREASANAAVRLIKAAGYTNAGTVEFLVDQEAEFLPPRSERPHPGRASGHRTGHRHRPDQGADPHRRRRAAAASSRRTSRRRGHAIECRINAEDPATKFRPLARPDRGTARPRRPGRAARFARLRRLPHPAELRLHDRQADRPPPHPRRSHRHDEARPQRIPHRRRSRRRSRCICRSWTTTNSKAATWIPDSSSGVLLGK